MHLAYVYIEHSVMSLDRPFCYRCDGFSLARGMRVKVPFGNKLLVGFVDHIEETEETFLDTCSYEIKDIIAVIDEEPLIDEELFALAHWMAQTCVAPLISCFQCMLPSKLKPKSSHGALKKEAWVVYQRPLPDLTRRQKEIMAVMEVRREMLRSSFYKEFKSAGKALISLGVLRVEERLAQAKLIKQSIATESLSLTKEQQEAITKVKDGKSRIYLLHGTTGSGKTEVFLQLAQHVIKEGKQVLLLVPEIALTPQMMDRVSRRFGAAAAIYHSGLNEQEKYEQYMLVKQHRVAIVVGTRSAVFMPFDRLGLIIMDEEHDTSYKQDVSPRYHCRDIAIRRAETHHCSVVLASATPSLESYARAYKGVYELIQMPSRINGQFPQVTMVDMRKTLANRENYIMSDMLLQKVYERLQRKEQVLLLLNRRGYTPILRCVECGYVQMCPHCDIAMSYHKDEQLLKCHTCGHTMRLPQNCPECGKSAWRYLGLGTQRLEEFVQTKFPEARIVRMDADTTSRKFSHEELLGKFYRHEADILIGTQMIAKGLDFESVTLVGILNGDALLHRSDYRCAELTYDLLEQASGRSGRHAKAGEVIIQAYDTTHYAITCAAQHQYEAFFQQEMNYRHLAGYPPFAYLASLVLIHKQEDLALACATSYLHQLRAHQDIKVLGPGCLGKSKDEYRVRLLLKGKQQQRLNELIWSIYKQHLAARKKPRIEIDLQPLVLD